jgi:hypothetical protein
MIKHQNKKRGIKKPLSHDPERVAQNQLIWSVCVVLGVLLVALQQASSAKSPWGTQSHGLTQPLETHLPWAAAQIPSSLPPETLLTADPGINRSAIWKPDPHFTDRVPSSSSSAR